MQQPKEANPPRGRARVPALLSALLLALATACSADADLFGSDASGSDSRDTGTAEGSRDATAPTGESPGTSDPTSSESSESGAGTTTLPGASGGTTEAPPGPGRVPANRLNRAEYDNTVRDLLGTEERPAQDWPSDDHGHGFDHMADVLVTTPLHVELALRSAERLIDEALEQYVAPVRTLQWDANTLEGTAGGPNDRGWYLWSNGEVGTEFSVEEAGRWQLIGWLGGDRGGPDLPEAVFALNGEPVGTFAVEALRLDERPHEVEVELDAGTHHFAVRFTNDFYDPAAGEDSNLFVTELLVRGPIDKVVGANPMREVLLFCDVAQEGEAGSACVADVVEAFAERAWRRPVTEDEVARLAALAAEGGALVDAEFGVRAALTTVLSSPHFLYRAEPEPAAGEPDPRPLTDHELATRLSYLLWSSMPDETLRAVADAGRLQEDDELEAQVRRMLADPRAEALIENFAGQWLYFRALDDAAPDYGVFPEWSEALRESMRRELHLFMTPFLRGELGMGELLVARDTQVDGRLAAFYGVDAPGAEEGVFVDARIEERPGLLGRAGLLTALSYPNRTSPVLRGKWVLGQLLCQEPAAPPAGVDGLPEEVDTGEMTLRELMERHSSDPLCAACHVQMDPIGFGMENFDGIGRWRSMIDGVAIDVSGSLPGDRHFDGAGELAALLADDPAFAACVVEHTFRYALRRDYRREEMPLLHALEQRFVAADLRLPELLVDLVLSEPFRMRASE